MAIRHIPATSVKTCDSCGVEMNASNSRKDGKLTISAAALDTYGHPVADGSQHYDLCDGCLHRVESASLKAIRAEPCA